MGNHPSVKRPARKPQYPDGKVSPQHPIPNRPGPRTIRVLSKTWEDLKETYTLGQELGRGAYGVTRICTDKTTGEMLACKSISKRRLRREQDVDDVRQEVAILNRLKGHPNIVKLKNTYEDRRAVHLVMDLCTGGELLKRITSKGKYSEREAAAVFRTVIEVLKDCHSCGVMHRDLKPENLLLLNEDEDSPIVMVDFGLSTFFKPGEIFRDLAGSAYYVAPEVLRGEYGPEADIWSAGVILYFLLSGSLPFMGDTNERIFDAILSGSFDLSSEPWPSISPLAKDLLTNMLKANPKERLPLHQIQNHPWVKIDGEASDSPLNVMVVTRMKQCCEMNQLKKLAFKVVAETMSQEEIERMKELFISMDTDNSGTLSLRELKEAFMGQGLAVFEKEMRQLLSAVDIDESGCIDFKEFIAAMMDIRKLEEEEKIISAFQSFDTNNDGFISDAELREALAKCNMGDEDDINRIIAEVDRTKDGRIDYEEFVAMMQQDTSSHC
ncbi:hypothetical protein KP509_04G009200 [Ceratopteris richardii]|uniref:non-specific serine/threonine protein kinase n=1 Tax=Ceratopteris richardii TaxID=49495 RepID=A0A8T2UUG0_CERRI|nr:hypothetical protein KP509_04G009200 [Ceratopteris richardii]